MKTPYKLFLLFQLAVFSEILMTNIYAQFLNKPLDEYLGTFAFPLEIGNVWTYRDGYFQPDMKLSIIDTAIIGGKKYYLKRDQTPSGYSSAFQYLRLGEDGFYVSRVLDSILTIFPNEDYLFYKKDANVGDVWIQEDVRGKSWYHKVFDTIQVASFWGSFLPVKIVETTDSSLTTYWEYWSEEFGLVRQQNSDWFSGGWSFLWGCYINGQKYGDTVLVSVDDEISDYPDNFNLYQNFPNPFNSSTIIFYEIPSTSFISLIFYDVLGNEVAKLIDEVKPAGRYEVSFNASGLSSGVYFYKVTSGKFVETRKMLLMK
ncbi:MAG: T9SS type A sorting domain-containing protein [Ignavibacteriaceae bacterium]|jgi:hypothetical protein|nr:T9SS type A sorting domain-containing protein [Ignavibacteriaceae bacterium]